MALLLDIFLIVLLLFTIWRGYKRGVVKSVIKLALMLLSVFFAKILSGIIAPSLSQVLPMPGIGTKLTSYLNINVAKLEEISLGELLSKWGLPEKASQSIDRFFINTAQNTSESISRRLTPEIDRLFTEIIVFIFLLIFFWLVSLLLTTLIDNALTLPVISTVSKAAGLGAGLLYGLLTVFIFSFIIAWAMPLLDVSMDTDLTSLLVEKSRLINFFNLINPFTGLLG